MHENNCLVMFLPLFIILFFWHHHLIIIPGIVFLHSFLDIQAKGKAIKKETMIFVQTCGDQEENEESMKILVKTSRGKQNEMNKT